MNQRSASASPTWRSRSQCKTSGKRDKRYKMHTSLLKSTAHSPNTRDLFSKICGENTQKLSRLSIGYAKSKSENKSRSPFLVRHVCPKIDVLDLKKKICQYWLEYFCLSCTSRSASCWRNLIATHLKIEVLFYSVWNCPVELIDISRKSGKPVNIQEMKETLLRQKFKYTFQ